MNTTYYWQVVAKNNCGNAPQGPTWGFSTNNPQGSLVFVTSQSYTGNLGGAAGADSICQQLTTTAGLSGTCKAWISTSTSDPSSTFIQSPYPYVLLDGTTVALSWTALTSSIPAAGIYIDENGNNFESTEPSPCVWTSTNNDGTTIVNGDQPWDCNEWTDGSNDFSGSGTQIVWPDGDWSYIPGTPLVCLTACHLYCFQQQAEEEVPTFLKGKSQTGHNPQVTTGKPPHLSNVLNNDVRWEIRRDSQLTQRSTDNPSKGEPKGSPLLLLIKPGCTCNKVPYRPFCY